MGYGVDDLLAALDLDSSGPNEFRGHSPSAGWRRVFGGLVVAQALVAVQRTVDGRPVHSLHGSFLLPGDPLRPIDYAVERLRDGGSFSTRRCIATQEGGAIFALTASFHGPESDALDHAAPMPDVPAPEDLPSCVDIRRGSFEGLSPAVRTYFERDTPIEIRPVDLGRFARREPGPARQDIWMRAEGPLPQDAAVHAAVLAYMSDMTLLDTALAAHGRSVFEPSLQVASLDHAVWFHRASRVDDWLLYSADSPSASGSRGFTRGLIFARDGSLVASTAQEGLIRRRAAR